MTQPHRRTLKALQDLAAYNFVLLHKLLNGQTQAKWQLVLGTPTAPTLLEGHCLEQTRWTQLIQLTWSVPAEQEQPWLLDQQMLVRHYQDVHLAEVIAYQRQQVRQGHYIYPNAQMYHPDEKRQINQLLREWLHEALQTGYPAFSTPTQGSADAHL